MKRPIPPENLGRLIGDYPVNVMPGLDIPLWVKETFLSPDSKLFNNDHYHLLDGMELGQVGFLWSVGGYTKQMRTIIGLTEKIAFRAGYWQKIRYEQQMHEWFGLNYPEFIITLDADYCAQCSDLEFCALVEHELYHVGHELDQFGAPKFHKDSGLPSLTIRGHDVEEFIGVVERYGPSSEVARLIDAANAKPKIARVDIARACGTCLRVAA